MKYGGGCHCGNIALKFDTAQNPKDMEIRACLCSFCRKHGTRAVADPRGSLVISVVDENLLNRYLFGLRTAAYLTCRACGVYVAAVTLEESDRRALVIVNALDRHEDFSRHPTEVSYDTEALEARLKRRRAGWTPVSIEFAKA